MKKWFFCCAAVLAFSALALAAPPSEPAGCADGVVVSSIGFEGLEHTNTRVVERELLNRVGEPFSAEKFEAEKLRLQDLDLFTEITVTCTPAAPQPSSNQDTLSSLVPSAGSGQASRLSSKPKQTIAL